MNWLDEKFTGVRQDCRHIFVCACIFGFNEEKTIKDTVSQYCDDEKKIYAEKLLRYWYKKNKDLYGENQKEWKEFYIALPKK